MSASQPPAPVNVTTQDSSGSAVVCDSDTPPEPLQLPHNLNLFLCRHGERVDQVFGIDWIEQAFRTYKIHGAEERMERERLEAVAARLKAKEARRAAQAEIRSHSIMDLPTGDSDDEEDENMTHASPTSFSFSTTTNGANQHNGATEALHHASYVRFNLNMPKDVPSRLPRRDITHYAEDAPLTECGHWQAGLVGEALQGANIQYVYSSPALRCVQTAQEICQALGLVSPPTAMPIGPNTATSSPIIVPSTSPSLLPVIPTPFAPAAPPPFAGIRIEYGLFEWMGWYSKYPHWLHPRELIHSGLCVDSSYVPCSLRPKQGETQREWYERSSDTMQRILWRHFGRPGCAQPTRSGHSSSAGSRRQSMMMVQPEIPPLSLGSTPPITSSVASPKPASNTATSHSNPLLYAHGNILFVAHAGSLDTLSYGLLHSYIPPTSTSIPPSISTAPSAEELAMGKRMRLFSNYCGIGRIQYIKHSHEALAQTPQKDKDAGSHSRRNSLTTMHESDFAHLAGRWQIADDSHYDMTNTSNDPFSFQLSYASYQKTMAHLLSGSTPSSKVLHSPQSVATLTQLAKQARESGDLQGANAIVIPHISTTPSDTPPHTPPRSVSPIHNPLYSRAHLAMSSERTPDLSFRASFGPILDACNSLANFILSLSEKQKEKLSNHVARNQPHLLPGQSPRLQTSASTITESTTTNPLSPPGKHRTSLSHGALPSPSPPANGTVMFFQNGPNGAGPNVSLTVPAPSPSASSSNGPNSPVPPPPISVLDSWILLEVAKTSARVINVLPEWSALRQDNDLIPLHVFKLMVSLRRFVVPLKKWGRLPRADKNLISWLCLLHHIAPADCYHSCALTHANHTHSCHVRCDFVCALSSCIIAVGILTRQGFARKFGNSPSASPTLSSSSPTPYSASRELKEWIHRAKSLRDSLKHAAATANCGNGAMTTPTAHSGASNSSTPTSSRPSSPPPPTRLPPRTDGFPHSYDLVELIDGLQPIFGTDALCADLLKAVLLAPLFIGLVVPPGPTAPNTTHATDPADSVTGARFQSVLLANSAHEYTTSLTSSSSLPINAPLSPRSSATAGSGPTDPVSTSSTSTPTDPDPSSSASQSSLRPFSVPSELLALFPSLLTPRLFDALYLFTHAHLSADHITHPSMQAQVVLELQDRMGDVKQLWPLLPPIPPTIHHHITVPTADPMAGFHTI